MTDYLLLLLILIPFIGALFVITAKNDRYYAVDNVYRVSIWTILAELAFQLYVFSFFDIEKNGIQLIEKYRWLNAPEIDILLGADIFSMILALSINLSFLIAVICISRTAARAKTLLASELMFISLLHGYFFAADLFSFYIFFAALSMPLIILVSTSGNQNKKNIFKRFSIYNLIGATVLFLALMMIYGIKGGNIPLNTISHINLQGNIQYIVWLSIFFAFISRLPVWPFHYWMASINATLKNPLVFLASNLVPLSGLYGFMRFWPNTVPATIGRYAPLFEAACIITMLFISLISLSHKEIRYKLFAYTTVYCLLYLIGVFLPTSALKQNIGYSLFAYTIIITVISLLLSHIEEMKKQLNLGQGILCYMPKASKCLSLFVLAAIGLPVTPLFWNNFIIVSEIFNYSLLVGILVMLSMFIVALALLEELYRLKDKNYAACANTKNIDLSETHFMICMISLAVLFFSFIKPLWFVFNGG
ncbi:MAG: hypothetical protein J6C85_06500 [Alphaproteobacteria bacterium]|nr:hypothetical protein [Alphaproteobacteria bacterium]